MAITSSRPPEHDVEQLDAPLHVGRERHHVSKRTVTPRSRMHILGFSTLGGLFDMKYIYNVVWNVNLLAQPIPVLGWDSLVVVIQGLTWVGGL